MATAPIEDEFHIAVICALDLEAREVIRQFDEEYEHLPLAVTRKGRTYPVIPGRIADQNIVLIWLLEIGKADAYLASEALQETYTEIHQYYVVGICGGVPDILDGGNGKAEVMLGDVIISTEILTHDERSTYPNHFDIKHLPVKPSTELISFMKPRLAGRRRKALQDRLHEIMQGSPTEHAPIPQHPGVDKDYLYDPSYHQKHHEGCFTCAKIGGCQESLKLNCTDLGCDAAKLVKRSRVTPGKQHRHAIQFGIVASGSIVMKSGEERDYIANMSKYKRRVVAFEMESAGICKEGLDVVVIKSVCDYSDSHKRKDWQPYAAFVGAVAFRVFVEAWASRNSRVNKIKDKIQTIPEDVKHGVRSGLEDLKCRPLSPLQSYSGQETDSKNNIGADRNLAVPGGPQHRRVGSSNSLRSFFRLGASDSPTAAPPERNSHHTPILSPKDASPTLQHVAPSQPPSQTYSNPPALFVSQPQTQPQTQPQSQPQTQHTYAPSQPTSLRRIDYSQITPPADDSTQCPAVIIPTHDPQAAQQYFFPTTQVGGQPPTPPRTPPQTPPLHHAARFSSSAGESRSSSIAGVDRNNVYDHVHYRNSGASESTIVVGSSGPPPSSTSNKIQGMSPVTEFPVFIAACEDHDLVIMEKWLQPKTIDLTTSASDGSNMLHLTLGTGIVEEDEKQLIANAVSLLCKYGADVNARDRSGARPLHYCATTMNQKAAEVLLSYKAKVNYTDYDGYTALNYLAEDYQPDVELAKLLIKKRGKLGKTARMSPMPPKPTRQQKLVRELLSMYKCDC